MKKGTSAIYGTKEAWRSEKGAWHHEKGAWHRAILFFFR
jgi:hypothetical protein